VKSFAFVNLIFLVVFLTKGIIITAFGALNTTADTLMHFPMMGYATVSGEGYEQTTGGDGGDTVHIYSFTELNNWALSREDETMPEIAVIHGKITSSSSTVVTIKHGANISILGVGNTSELENVGLNIWDYKNIIVFNLKIHEIFYPNDAITINECQHVWIDHCELHSLIGEGIGVDTYDGLLDIKEGSRYVTVSWCYLHDHMKTSLIGHTDNVNQMETDTMMRVTMHHNYFQNTDGRNPSLRFGAVHMFNNYLENITDYGIAVRQGGHAKLDNNHFHSVKLPVTTNKFDGPEGFVCESGTLYSGSCSAGDNSITQTDCEWWSSLPYEFTLDSIDVVATIVQTYSGTGKTATPGGIYVSDTATGIIPVVLMPEFSENSIVIKGIFPNPCTDQVNISLYLQESGKLSVKVFSQTGSVQKEMVYEYLNPGIKMVIMDKGSLLPGIYLISFEFEQHRITKKLSISY